MSKESTLEFINCSFEFKCPESWNDLKDTESESIKHCSQCDRHVHYCATKDELLLAIKASHCVALPRELADGVFEVGEDMLMGSVVCDDEYGSS